MSDDYMAAMAARRKRRLRIASRVVAALAVVGFVVWGPGLMIDRAHASASACSNADYEEGPNPKTDCTGGKAWLLLPKVVPWKRAEALHESESIDIDSVERRLRQATTFAPNVDEQTRAVADLGKLRAEAPSHLTADQYSGMLTQYGVAWRMGAERSGLDSTSSQNRYLRQLIQRGSIDDAIAFARSAPAVATEDYSARELFLTRGVLLCLSGAQTEGQAALHHAISVHAKFHSFVYIEARIALAACGEVIPPGKDDLDRDPLATFALSQGLSGAGLEMDVLGDDLSRPRVYLGNASILVAAALAERERPLDRTLRLVSGTASPLTDALSPWPWSTPIEGTPYFVDPDRDERAADRLESIAKTAPEKGTALDSDAELALRMDYRIKDRYIAALAAPQATLRNAARGYWLEAAGGRSRMGQCDKAEADGRRMLPLGPTSEERLYLAVSLLRCGHFEAAGEMSHEDEGTPLLRALLFGVIKVHALAHAGKFDEALALTRQLAQRSAPVVRPTDDVGRVLSDSFPVTSAIDWLLLALSLHQGDASAAPSVDTPSIFEREKTNWRDLIAKPEPERAVLRWRMSDADLELSSAGRPAELFVFGKATDGNVEVWLDKVAQAYTVAGGLPYMRARAEAARWRGDAKAESDWLARATATETRLADPKNLALAKLVGL